MKHIIYKLYTTTYTHYMGEELLLFIKRKCIINETTNIIIQIQFHINVLKEQQQQKRDVLTFEPYQNKS